MAARNPISSTNPGFSEDSQNSTGQHGLELLDAAARMTASSLTLCQFAKGTEGMSDNHQLLPRSAYIHVPFCARKCGYCNFTVVAGRDGLVEAYLQAIEIELSGLGDPREVDTLYFGGGTPTFLAAMDMARLFETVLCWHPLANGYEWTVEANPTDLDADRLAVLADYGVNRVSLGAQSFDEAKLKQLERSHRAADIERAAAAVRAIGADLALDLIFAVPNSVPDVPNVRNVLPGEARAGWQNDLETAVALAPDHLSIYGLTIERGSAFFGRRARGELFEIGESAQRAMYLEAIDRLTAAGYEHYEVSNFARPGKRSRHNQVYWRGDSYYAAGPGAARYVGGQRATNHRSTTAYIRRIRAGQSPVAEQETLPPEERARELLVFSLRQLDGITRDDFADRTGFAIDRLAGPAIGRFVRMGLLADHGDRIHLTREGLLVSDSLWPELL